MGEILTDPAAQLEDIVDAGMHMGASSLVLELIAHEGHHAHHVFGDILGAARARTVPEEFAQALAEGT